MNLETAIDCVNDWYSEISMYDFSTNVRIPGTGHFTQVVWNDSTQLGMGLTIAPSNGRLLCVAQYQNSGNWVGEYTKNVAPVKA